MIGETSFPEFLGALQTIAEEMSAIRASLNLIQKGLDKVLPIGEESRAIRANLQRVNENLEHMNRLKGNHPSRI